MGSDILESDGKSPSFLVWALRDIKRAPLDRVQVIKDQEFRNEEDQKK